MPLNFTTPRRRKLPGLDLPKPPSTDQLGPIPNFADDPKTENLSAAPSPALKLALNVQAAKQQAPASTSVLNAVPHAVQAADRKLPAGGGQQAVGLAQREVGFREGAGNRNKYGPATAWCGYFVSYIAKHAGAKGLTDRVAYVPNIVSDAKSRSNGFIGWSTASSWARPGDFVVMHGRGHVEMVVSVNKDGSVNTVGGNTSVPGGEGVGRKRRSRGEITGFARPRYA